MPASGQRDPWSGDLADDHVWGRGALDMKNQVAASAVAIASLAREGFEPPGDLVFVAAADEEVGEASGCSGSATRIRTRCECDYAINEGGGERVELGGRAFYLCATRREDERAVPDHACTAAAGTPRCRASPTTRSSRRRR